MTETTVLASGLAMGESPRWHEGRLWAYDAKGRQVVVRDPPDQRCRRVRGPDESLESRAITTVATDPMTDIVPFSPQ